MALSASRAMSKGVVITVPVLVLSALVAAVFLFFLFSSLSSCSCPSTSGPPVNPIANAVSVGGTGVSDSGSGGFTLSTRKADVEWVKNQIIANGLHMHDNVLRKGINPRTRAQQLEDLRQ